MFLDFKLLLISQIKVKIFSKGCQSLAPDNCDHLYFKHSDLQHFLDVVSTLRNTSSAGHERHQSLLFISCFREASRDNPEILEQAVPNGHGYSQ